MQERAVAMLRPALGMDGHGKTARQARRKRGAGGRPGRDARLDVVTMQVQDKRLVGGPAQLDALALGRAQHLLRWRHAALRYAKLERAQAGWWTLGVGDDRQRKAWTERNDSRDDPCCRHCVIVA